MFKKLNIRSILRKMRSLPFVFDGNRVWRIYQGGKLIDTMQHNPYPANSNFPEEWIASSVKACNPRRGGITEGISNAIFKGELV